MFGASQCSRVSGGLGQSDFTPDATGRLGAIETTGRLITPASPTVALCVYSHILALPASR